MPVQAEGVPAPQQFLEQLWGRAPRGLVQTCEIDAKGARAGLWNSPAGTTVLTGRPDVYTCVALAHPQWREKNPGHRSRRPVAKDAIAIPGLWIDFDVAGGPQPHAPGKTPIPTLEDATGLACSFEVPTLMVGSGYGLHAWYLFDGGPWYFTSYEDQSEAAVMAAQWFALHRKKAAASGWSIDAAHDLARLMRLPGTVNAKGGLSAPVTLLDQRGPRARRSYLKMLCDTAGPVDITPPAAQNTAVGTARSASALASEALEILLESDPKLHATFFGTRQMASASERDLALCARVVVARANAGMQTPDDMLAGLITAHRLHHDPTDTKHRRDRYVAMTIQKARAHESRAQHAHTAADLAALARRAA